MYRTHLLVNTGAGRRDRRNLAQQAAFFLRSKGWEVIMQQPGSAQELLTMTTQAAKENSDAVIIMGGDGTLNLAARALTGTSTALAAIPTGTSNVWALEVGLVKNPMPSDREIWPAVELLAASQKRQVDLGVANGRPFLLWAGIGLDGLAIHHIEPRPRWSKWIPVQHYAYHTIMQLVHWRGMKLSIEVDGSLVHDRCIALVLANASRYMGGKTLLSPQMHLDDGLLNAWLIEGSQPLEAFDQAFRLLQNRHHWKHVKEIPFRQLRAWAPEPLWLQVDGDPIRGSLWPVDVHVQPGALWVLTPPPPRDLFVRQ